MNEENPPNSKIFGPPCHRCHGGDVALLAKRRLAQNREAAAPAITVNFPGFADIFRAPNTPEIPAAVNAVARAPAAIDSVRQRAPPPPPMMLDNFCRLYKLADDIKAKLDIIHIAGPHVLRLVSDSDLRDSGGLDVGEVATVRDAEQRWAHALTHAAT